VVAVVGMKTGAVVVGTVVGGAVTGGAVTGGAVTGGAVTGGAVTGGAVTDCGGSVLVVVDAARRVSSLWCITSPTMRIAAHMTPAQMSNRVMTPPMSSTGRIDSPGAQSLAVTWLCYRLVGHQAEGPANQLGCCVTRSAPTHFKDANDQLASVPLSASSARYDPDSVSH
jgi:hypothetical protein